MVISLFACSTFDAKQDKIEYERELRERLSKVDISNGISKEEAIAISDNYYYRFTFSGCGAPGEIEESETTWNRVVHIGIAAQEEPERIIIDKKTGRTTWKFGPDINNIKEIWRPEHANQPDAE